MASHLTLQQRPVGYIENERFMYHLWLRLKCGHRLDTVAHACNPSTQEAEAGKLPIQSQPGLHSKIVAKTKQTKKFKR